MKKTCFVIPCYNEEANIPKLTLELEKINKEDPSINFILVNNGSVDNSYKILMNEASNLPCINVVNVEENQGMGYGIMCGINKALENVEFGFIGWTHADLQIPTSSLITANTLMNNNITSSEKIYIRGFRKNRNSVLDVIFTIMMAIYTSLMKKGYYWDITGLPVLTDREFIKLITQNYQYGFAFDVSTYILANRNNAKILRFPVYFQKRIHGKSSWNTGLYSRIKMSLYYIKNIFYI
tara:strand:- start:45648 stop:46361 length:714 start_codon:yes stop_codon:yes gene_type:complete